MCFRINHYLRAEVVKMSNAELPSKRFTSDFTTIALRPFGNCVKQRGEFLIHSNGK